MSWRRQDQRGGPVALDGDAERLGRLVGVGRADDPQAGHGPHAGQLLDGLVGRAVLAEADRVVGPEVDDLGLAEGGQADRAPHVVAEDRRTCRRPGGCPPWSAIPFMMPPMPCSRTPKASCRPSGCSLDCWVVSSSLVPVLPVRSAPPATRPGTSSTMALRHGLRAWRVATFSPGFHVGSLSANPARPWPRHAASQTSRSPSQASKRSARPVGVGPGRARLTVEVEHLVGHPERLVGGQAEDLLGRPDLLLAERGPVGLRGVGHVRRRPADVAAQDRASEGRSSSAMARRSAGLEGVGVVGHLAQVLDVPAVGLEAADGVVVEGDLGRAVDGDVVVVVDVDQPAEAEVAGQRRRLVADALHEVAVAADHEGVVVDEVGAEPGPQHPLGDAHARRRWRSPGRAGRWSPRSRGRGAPRGARGCGCAAGGTGARSSSSRP